ncbi:MAG: hypothetical protein ACLPPV_16675 [Candidatus Korobacteraceae bacterium]|jgi:hypothetical protein
MRADKGTVAASADYCPMVLGFYDHAVYIIIGRYGCDGRVAQPAIVGAGSCRIVRLRGAALIRGFSNEWDREAEYVVLIGHS